MSINLQDELPLDAAEDSRMDYASLREEAIHQLMRLSGGQWTDFNDHDPGITILEQLCYALTDLGYRIDYVIPDLLASSGDPARDLYTPGQVLASEPVTLTDLRKLALDVPGVKNAWIEPVKPDPPACRYSEELGQIAVKGDPQATEPIALKGLYRVLIHKHEASVGDVAWDVTLRLHAHRNLCEDFAEVSVLNPTKVALQASVEIGQVDDAEQVLVEIYRAVADYLAPSVAFLTLDEMLAAGKRVDEIFAGPLLEHGFIDDKSLGRLERRTVVHTSDLIRVIMGVRNVRAVRQISVSVGDGRPKPWSLDLKGGVPTLDLDHSKVTLQKGELEARLDRERVKTMYDQRPSNAPVQGPSAGRCDLVPPPGRDRHIDRYHSIQHQLPALYGVGALGLPDSAPPDRKARAKQLKAYLMFFDQILANDFAQLAHLGDIFSFDAENAGAYFAQEIDDPTLGLDDILLGPRSEARSPNSAAAGTAPADQRRNRILNHLLARFAEQFSPYSLALFDVLAGQDERRRALQTAREDKDKKDGQGGFDAMLHAALGEDPATAAPSPLDRLQEILKADDHAFLKGVAARKSADVTPEDWDRAYRVFDVEPRLKSGEDVIRTLIRAKQAFLRRYPRVSGGRGTAFDYWKPWGAANRSGLEERVRLKLGVEQDGPEQFLLVEHILLRPMQGDEGQDPPLLAGVHTRDPYSLQLSFVFPIAGRFKTNDSFCRLAEQTVREETPAHLTPYILWIEKPAMTAFRDAYRDWVDKLRTDSMA